MVDILLRHEDQKFLEAGLRYIKNLQTKYVLESLLESFLLEKQANEACEFESFQSEVANCGWAGLYQSTLLPPSQGHLSQSEFIIVKGVIVTTALRALQCALRGSLEDLLSLFRSDDWKLYIHPYLLARTVKVVSVIDRKLTPIVIPRLTPFKLEPNPTERIIKALASMEEVVCQLRNSLFYQRQEEKHRRSYAKWLWRQFYKSQITTGLWALPKTLSPVFKLDPEFDLQLKSFRLKQVSNRSSDYYLKKAHKRTLKQIQQEALRLRKRHSVVSGNYAEYSSKEVLPNTSQLPTLLTTQDKGPLSANHQGSEICTPLAVCRLYVKEEDNVRALAKERAVGEEMEDKEEDGAFTAGHTWTFECERIQHKGACFGVIEISPTFFYFKSAGKKKPADPKYFGSALVFSI